MIQEVVWCCYFAMSFCLVRSLRLQREYRVRRKIASMTTLRSSKSSSPLETSEFLLYSSNSHEFLPYLQALATLRPSLGLYDVSERDVATDGRAMWNRYRGGVQLDCCILEPHWLGARQSTQEETILRWEKNLGLRMQHTSSVVNSEPTSCPTLPSINIGDGGKYQQELDTAVIAVQAASFMSRT